VEGRLKYGTYTDKTTGVEKNTVDIIATELQLLGGREGKGAPSGGGEEGGYSRAPASKPAAASASPASAGAKAPAKGGFDDMDDDIPF
jgi:single-strand DNA-binding protein